MKIGLRSEEKLVDTMQSFESLTIVASRIFGGDEADKADPRTAPKTANDLERTLAQALG